MPQSALSARAKAKPKWEGTFVPVGCKTHGHKYLREGSNVCLAPTCIRGVICTLMERNTSLRNSWCRYQALCLDEDFVQHVIFYMLTTPNVFFLNNTVMCIICDRFSEQGYQPKQEYHTNYTREFMVSERLDSVRNLERHELLQEAVDRATESSSPYTTTLMHEVLNHVQDEELLLFLAGQLDPEDMALLKAANRTDVIDLIKVYKDQLPILAEWVRSYAKS